MKGKKKSSNNVSIGPATQADLHSLEPLISELMEAMDDTEGFDIEQAVRNCGALLKDPAHHLLLAKEKDKVVGLVNFNTRKTLLHLGPSGLIDELVVAASHRGLGIGRKLLDSAIEKCRDLGCCEVEVSTEKTNTQAREFYRKCGFKEDAVLLELTFE